MSIPIPNLVFARPTLVARLRFFARERSRSIRALIIVLALVSDSVGFPMCAEVEARPGQTDLRAELDHAVQEAERQRGEAVAFLRGLPAEADIPEAAKRAEAYAAEYIRIHQDGDTISKATGIFFLLWEQRRALAVKEGELQKSLKTVTQDSLRAALNSAVIKVQEAQRTLETTYQRAVMLRAQMVKFQDFARQVPEIYTQLVSVDPSMAVTEIRNAVQKELSSIAPQTPFTNTDEPIHPTSDDRNSGSVAQAKWEPLSIFKDTKEKDEPPLQPLGQAAASGEPAGTGQRRSENATAQPAKPKSNAQTEPDLAAFNRTLLELARRYCKPTQENSQSAAGAIVLPATGANGPAHQQTFTLDSSKFKEFVEFNKLDRKPIARTQPAPRYPFEMKRQGISGECIVQFFVDEEGAVSGAVAVSASHREFVKPSIEAVMQWRFKPGMKNGRAVATRMQQTLPYTLSN